MTIDIDILFIVGQGFRVARVAVNDKRLRDFHENLHVENVPAVLTAGTF
jgi:hypothetical protein